MKNPSVFFKPIEGSAPMTVSFFDGPKGKAVEDMNELGVGFFSSDGTLLGVIFDDVQENADHQVLEFKGGLRVEVKVKKGHTQVSVQHKNPKAS
ncbi:MAG: hypothetical protein ACOYOK_01315 [Pseudobdellovibrionaceae bacterium]